MIRQSVMLLKRCVLTLLGLFSFQPNILNILQIPLALSLFFIELKKCSFAPCTNANSIDEVMNLVQI